MTRANSTVAASLAAFVIDHPLGIRLHLPAGRHVHRLHAISQGSWGLEPIIPGSQGRSVPHPSRSAVVVRRTNRGPRRLPLVGVRAWRQGPSGRSPSSSALLTASGAWVLDSNCVGPLDDSERAGTPVVESSADGVVELTPRAIDTVPTLAQSWRPRV